MIKAFRNAYFTETVQAELNARGFACIDMSDITLINIKVYVKFFRIFTNEIANDKIFFVNCKDHVKSVLFSKLF